MGTFTAGDRVKDTTTGNTGVVVDLSEAIAVRWDGTQRIALCPAKDFTFARSFEPGDWVRVTYGGADFIGYVYEDDNGPEDFWPYSVALNDEEGSEEQFSANELALWIPEVGDRVFDAEDDDDIAGTVIEALDGTTTATVMWDGYTRPQYYQYEDLEPSDWEPTVVAGDTVEYVSQFEGSHRGKVTRIEGNIVYVEFDQKSYLPDGGYPLAAFSKQKEA